MMKRIMTVAFLVCVGTVAVSAMDFNPFVIRNSNGDGVAPIIVENSAQDGADCRTPLGGQKVGYGTHYFDGMTFGAIETVDFQRLGGPSNIVPYCNVWVTDGAGNYAVISTENDYRGEDWATWDQFKVFETDFSSLDWLLTGATRSGAQYLQKPDGQGGAVNVTGADLADLIIQDPGVYPNPPIGTGAPKGGYGFNIIWGDTAANYAGQFHYNQLTINGQQVPEPMTVGLLGMGGLVLARRKKA